VLSLELHNHDAGVAIGRKEHLNNKLKKMVAMLDFANYP